MELNGIAQIKDLLYKLNKKIDVVIRQKKKGNLDYGYIEKILLNILKNANYNNQSYVSIIVPIKKEEIIKVCLEFFKSIDKDFYEIIANSLFQQNKQLKQ